jgi:D-sedoheptulose 7-phosphate isomerase
MPLSDFDIISSNLNASAEVKKKMIDLCSKDIIKAAELITNCFLAGKKILLCGNGGSAADAQHIATEFVIRLSPERTRPALPAIALTTDTSYLTAGSNDLGYERVFSRAVEALGNEDDILIAISTSGDSPNIVNAVQLANERSMITIGLLGRDGGNLLSLCRHSIIIPSGDTQRIQEGHITAAHIVCQLVEEKMFG